MIFKATLEKSAQRKEFKKNITYSSGNHLFCFIVNLYVTEF